jgi:hypothetical protein
MELHKDDDDNTPLTSKELEHALRDARYFMHVAFMHFICALYFCVNVILNYPNPKMFEPSPYIKFLQISTYIYLFYDVPHSFSLRRISKRDFTKPDRVTDYIITKYKMPWCWTPESSLENGGFFGNGSLFNEIIDTLFPMLPLLMF